MKEIKTWRKFIPGLAFPKGEDCFVIGREIRPTPLVYRTNHSKCGTTCSSYDRRDECEDDNMMFEGCGCDDGLVLNFDVSLQTISLCFELKGDSLDMVKWTNLKEMSTLLCHTSINKLDC